MSSDMEYSYHAITQYLNYLEEAYHVQICIKDFCGFIPINQNLDTALGPFLSHNNCFCMYMKSGTEHWHHCLDMIPQIYQKSLKLRRPFFGICHAGLGEYVIPIFSGDTLIGTINVGFFPIAPGRARHRICRACAKPPALDADKALALYQTHIETPTIKPEKLLPGLNMLAEYLGLTYQLLRKTHSTPEKRNKVSNEDTILAHALEYIRLQANTAITVSDLANFCHCSESYISRIFKRGTGININVYINKIRVEQSKDYLTFSTLPITNIASSVGFSDPNYYSRVFTKIIGIPPSEYRRRFQSQKIQ